MRVEKLGQVLRRAMSNNSKNLVGFSIENLSFSNKWTLRIEKLVCQLIN